MFLDRVRKKSVVQLLSAKKWYQPSDKIKKAWTLKALQSGIFGRALHKTQKEHSMEGQEACMLFTPAEVPGADPCQALTLRLAATPFTTLGFSFFVFKLCINPALLTLHHSRDNQG